MSSNSSNSPKPSVASAKTASVRSSASATASSTETANEKTGNDETDDVKETPAFQTRGSSSVKSYTTAEDHHLDEAVGKCSMTCYGSGDWT